MQRASLVFFVSLWCGSACSSPGSSNPQGGTYSSLMNAWSSWFEASCRCDTECGILSLPTAAEIECSNAAVAADPNIRAALECERQAVVTTTSCLLRQSCEAETYKCRDGSRIAIEFVCDDEPDCSEDEDEADCPDFACGDGTNISRAWVCDGEADCPNRRDEQNCSPITCAPFPDISNCPRLDDAQQLALRRCSLVLRCDDRTTPAGATGANYCDGVAQCADESDELRCP